MLTYLDELVGNDTTPNRSAAIALLLEKGRRVFEKEQLLEALSSLDEGEQQETAEWGMDEYGADLEAEFPQQKLWVPPSRLSQEQLHCDTDDDDA